MELEIITEKQQAKRLSIKQLVIEEFEKHIQVAKKKGDYFWFPSGLIKYHIFKRKGWI